MDIETSFQEGRLLGKPSIRKSSIAVCFWTTLPAEAMQVAMLVDLEAFEKNS